MSKTTQMFRVYGTLIARILMGGMFLLAGINKLQAIPQTTDYIASALPAAGLLVWVAIIIEIALGAALILGYKTSKSALGFAVFTLIAVFSFHGPSMWADQPMQQTLFMKDLAILAGLFYFVAYGPGDGWSLAQKKSAAPQTAQGQTTSSL